MAKGRDLKNKIFYEAYVRGIENSKGTIDERLKLKKNTVNYVLEKLKEEGYFSATKYEINLNTVGMVSFAWVLLSVDWDIQSPELFMKKLMKLPQIITIADITGGSDVAIKIVGPSVNNVSAFVLMMEKMFNGMITDTRVYFANHEYKRHYLAVQKNELFKLSEIDCDILYEKMKNPKVNLVEIAKKYNLHRNTVSNRWDKLWESGVIVKELPDLTQKGYDELKMGLKTFTLIKPVPGREERIIRVLMKKPEIQDVFTTLSNEIIVIMRTENSSTLAVSHKETARAHESIQKTITSIFLTKNAKNNVELAEMKNLLYNPQ